VPRIYLNVTGAHRLEETSKDTLFGSCEQIDWSNPAMSFPPSKRYDVLDAIIVGVGFDGVHLLKQLKDRGFNVLLMEMAADYGSVWCEFSVLCSTSLC
jgi:hypothetical protein